MKKRRTYTDEMKRESALLVVDQSYSIGEACSATGVSLSAMRRWVNQLKAERCGETPVTGKALTSAHQEIQSLRVQIKKLEREKAILKKASALLMSDSYTNMS